MKITKRLGNTPFAQWLLNALRERYSDIDVNGLMGGLGVKITLETITASHTDAQRQGFFQLLTMWFDLDEKLAEEVLPDKFHKKPRRVQMDALRNEVYKFHFGSIYVSDRHGNEVAKPVRSITSAWSWQHEQYVDQPIGLEEFSGLIERTIKLASERGVVIYLEKQDEKQASV